MDWTDIKPECKMPNNKEIVFLIIMYNNIPNVIQARYMDLSKYTFPKPGRELYDIPVLHDAFFRPIEEDDRKYVLEYFYIWPYAWKSKE